MLKPAFKLTLIIIWSVIMFPAVWLFYLLKKYDWRDKAMQLSSSGILFIIGVQLKAYGKLAGERPLLVVSNHISYIDIILLSSQGPLCFTPKSEIIKWPVIGYICKITGCVFVDRRTGKVKGTSKNMHEKLSNGEVISLFPEATTGDGIHMLPFKSSFFNLAEQEFSAGKLYIQPVALTYTGASNLPMDLRLWHKVAWVGDEDLMPHLWEFLALSPIKAEIHFLPPLTIENYSGRKALAAACQAMIEESLDMIRGREYVSVAAQSTSSGFSLFSGKSK